MRIRNILINMDTMRVSNKKINILINNSWKTNLK
jgi:hypothetical protein